MKKKLLLSVILYSIGYCNCIFSLTRFEQNIIKYAKDANIDSIKKILENPAIPPDDKDINAQDKNGRTALDHAAFLKNTPYKKYSDVVKFLLENGANPNSADKMGSTPLMRAAVLGDIESLKALVSDPRTKINQVSITGKTALDYARGAKAEEKENILLAQGAKSGSEFPEAPLKLMHQTLTNLTSALQKLNTMLTQL